MLNQNAKLNTKVFDTDVEQVPIRKGFGEGLLQAGKQNEQIVALCADLTESTMMHLFKNEFPNRFIEIGVAEQNLASVASGMAAMGKIPFISSYAMFSPGRNWEQIRTTICYNDRKVIIAGSHAGISVGPAGGTHQAIEDMALMRVMPNMCVITPCDALEAFKATIASVVWKTPIYIRLAREKTPIITTSETPFTIGKAQVFWESDKPKVTIFACEAIVHNALLAAKELENEGIGSIVVNISTIKPLDKQTIVENTKKTGRVITVEEHQVAGGMGSAIAECLAENNPVPIKFIGVRDRFGQSGKPTELIKEYGLDVIDIINAVKSFI